MDLGRKPYGCPSGDSLRGVFNVAVIRHTQQLNNDDRDELAVNANAGYPFSHVLSTRYASLEMRFARGF